MIRSWRVVLLAVATASLLAACGGSGGGSRTSAGGGGSGRVIATTGTPVQRGTAYWAEQPLSPPNYIFPLVSGAYYSNENVYEFQTLMYRPLYWYGDRGNTGVDYALSLGNAPVYSDHDRVVTITLKRAHWSDGETVSAQDVVFWIDLLNANRADWASYVPGGFPDNVQSYVATGPRTVRLTLNRGYNPVWFTNNELSQITPLLLAWEHVTKTGGPRAIYAYLNAQAKNVSGYATSPIWSIVDGPWKLQSLTSNGQATFVPNAEYEGPNKPKLSRFVELPFTSETAEFSVLPGRLGQGRRRRIVAADLCRLRARHRRAAGAGTEVSGVPAERLLPVRVRLLRAQLRQPRGGADPASAVLPPSLPAPRQPDRLDPRVLRRSRRTHLQPRSSSAVEPIRQRKGPRQPLPVQRDRSRADPAGTRMEGGAERDHHLHAPRQRLGRMRRRGPGRQAAALHADVPERHVLDRRGDGRPAVGRTSGWHPDHAQAGHDGNDRLGDRALLASHRRLRLAARPVRRGLGVRPGPLPHRRGDLPNGGAGERRQLHEPIRGPR